MKADDCYKLVHIKGKGLHIQDFDGNLLPQARRVTFEQESELFVHGLGIATIELYVDTRHIIDRDEE